MKAVAQPRRSSTRWIVNEHFQPGRLFQENGMKSNEACFTFFAAQATTASAYAAIAPRPLTLNSADLTSQSSARVAAAVSISRYSH